MVNVLLPGNGVDSADASDALAVAICHAHMAQVRRLQLKSEKAHVQETAR